MNQREAPRETLRLAEAHGMSELPESDLGLDHLQEMVATVEVSEFSDAKLGRWLGWAQCALVAANVGVGLADMKELNAKWAADEAGAVDLLVAKVDVEPAVPLGAWVSNTPGGVSG